VPLPGLIDSVSVEMTPDGRRLADSATGAVLPLSEGELRLLHQWDGRDTATALAVKTTAFGLSMDGAQIEAFFSRMSRIGVLALPPPVVPGAAMTPLGLTAPDDVVPAFRDDLRLDLAAGARGVIHVKDPMAGRTFTLYDFEVSIARLLDGRRSVQDVLNTAERLGVPLNLTALRAFVAQLRSFGFLETGAKPPRTRTSWKPRRAWSEEVRDLYQQALRLARRGDRHEALSCLESLFELDPKNEEAQALNTRLLDVTGRPAIGTSFDLLHTEAPPQAPAPAPGLKPDYPLAQGGVPFEALSAADAALFTTLPERPAPPPAAGADPSLSSTLPGDPGAAPDHPSPSAPLDAAPSFGDAAEETIREATSSSNSEVVENRRSFWPWVVLALGLAVGLAALFYPVSIVAGSACTVEPIELVALEAPSDGTVAYDVPSGQLVSVGQVIAHMKAGGDDAQALEARLKETLRRRSALGSVPDEKVAKTKRKLAHAELQLEAAKRQRARLAAQRAPAKKLAAAERVVKARDESVAKIRSAIDELTHASELAALDKTVAEVKEALEAARARTQSPDIVSPQVGRFVSEPKAAAGPDDTATVSKGAVVGRVMSTSLKVTPTDGEAPPLGRYAVVVGEATLQARSDASKLYVDGELSLAGKPCRVMVPEGRRPWVLTLLHD
jgi:hypothetical protein